MKRWTEILIVVATLATGLGTTSLWAESETLAVCCVAQDGCNGQVCCPWDWVAAAPCDLENPNICVSVCVRPGGN